MALRLHHVSLGEEAGKRSPATFQRDNLYGPISEAKSTFSPAFFDSHTEKLIPNVFFFFKSNSVRSNMDPLAEHDTPQVQCTQRAPKWHLFPMAKDAAHQLRFVKLAHAAKVCTFGLAAKLFSLMWPCLRCCESLWAVSYHDGRQHAPNNGGHDSWAVESICPKMCCLFFALLHCKSFNGYVMYLTVMDSCFTNWFTLSRRHSACHVWMFFRATKHTTVLTVLLCTQFCFVKLPCRDLSEKAKPLKASLPCHACVVSVYSNIVRQRTSSRKTSSLKF